MNSNENKEYEFSFRYLICFDENINCSTCKHGYYNGSDGDHNLCGVDNCYLCAEQAECCHDYKKGDIPEGKERI